MLVGRGAGVPRATSSHHRGPTRPAHTREAASSVAEMAGWPCLGEGLFARCHDVSPRRRGHSTDHEPFAPRTPVGGVAGNSQRCSENRHGTCYGHEFGTSLLKSLWGGVVLNLLLAEVIRRFRHAAPESELSGILFCVLSMSSHFPGCAGDMASQHTRARPKRRPTADAAPRRMRSLRDTAPPPAARRARPMTKAICWSSSQPRPSGPPPGEAEDAPAWALSRQRIHGRGNAASSGHLYRRLCHSTGACQGPGLGEVLRASTAKLGSQIHP